MTSLFKTDNDMDDEEDADLKALNDLKESNPEEYAEIMAKAESAMTDDEIKVKPEPKQPPSQQQQAIPSTDLNFWGITAPATLESQKRKTPAKKTKKPKSATSSSNSNNNNQPTSEALQQAKDDKKKLAADTKLSAAARFIDGHQLIQKQMNELWALMLKANKQRKFRQKVVDNDMTQRLDELLPFFASQWKKHVKSPPDADKAFAALLEQTMEKKWKKLVKPTQYQELVNDMGKACMNALTCFYAFVNVTGCKDALECIKHLETLPIKEEEDNKTKE